MRVVCAHCGKPFTVPESWKGQVVQCPGCNRTMRLEDPARPRLDSTSSEGAVQQGPSIAKPSPSRDERKVSSSVHTTEDDDELRLLPEDDSPRRHVWLDNMAFDDDPGAAVGALVRTESGGLHGTSTTKRESAGQGKKAPLGQSATKNCPNCDAVLPPDGIFCIECGYHTGLQRVLVGDLSDLDLDMSVGYVRWFRRQVEEGESITGILWLIHLLVAIVLTVIGVIGHPQLWIPVVFVFVSYVAFWLWLLKMGDVHCLGRTFWNWRLAWLRRFAWKWLPPAHYLQPADRNFSDADLAAVATLEEIRVLDAEGTSLTDRALVSLQRCKYLQAAVVRGTRMTRDGVLRLQIMMPHLSIWHDE